MQDDRLLNRVQVCARLGCARSQFYVLINSGRLPYIRVGKVRGIRVLESDVTTFIRERRKLGEESKKNSIKTI